MDPHGGELVVLRPDAFGVPDVLDAVRGVLAAALQRCGEGSDAGLEICAAWEAIDEVSAPSSILESGLPAGFGVGVVLATARRLLRGAILRVEPVASAFVLADALRHVDAAAALAAGRSTGQGPSWA